ncbi:MAG: GntR family transcriptional regulator [Lachnospiraceae bacterium]|nr:GntR family transcriptional regulator [Lachnospiraceae bacterium]
MNESHENRNENLKYVKLYNWARTLILSGVMRYGDKLPSEHMLERKFSYSRQTVRTALEVLEKEGLITRVKGSGTYVSFKTGNGSNDAPHIGLILSYFADYMFPQIYAGIESVMKEQNIGIDVAVTRNHINDEAVFLERCLNSNAAGLIVEGTRSAFPNPNIGLYESLIKKNIPVIFIHNHYSNMKFDSVEMYDAKCSHALTQLLIDNGHRNIGAVLKYDDMQGMERYRGFIDCMAEHGILIDDDRIQWYSTKDIDTIFSRKGIANMMRKFNGCTAIITYNDEVAAQLTNAFESKGIHVPQDYSIVSFDNASLTENSSLQLCSADHPKFELGKRAARNLLRMMDDSDWINSNYSYRFPVSIVSGNSIRDIH